MKLIAKNVSLKTIETDRFRTKLALEALQEIGLNTDGKLWTRRTNPY
jgi:hypothetical protein